MVSVISVNRRPRFVRTCRFKHAQQLSSCSCATWTKEERAICGATRVAGLANALLPRRRTPGDADAAAATAVAATAAYTAATPAVTATTATTKTSMSVGLCGPPVPSATTQQRAARGHAAAQQLPPHSRTRTRTKGCMVPCCMPACEPVGCSGDLAGPSCPQSMLSTWFTLCHHRVSGIVFR